MDDSLFSSTSIESQFSPDSILPEKIINWLFSVYEATDWRCITIDGNIDSEYDGISVVSIFKALALPYLVNISSERALWRVIVGNKELQKLCGFYLRNLPDEMEREEKKGKAKGKDEQKGDEREKDNMPKERTFWHFRNKYKSIYSDRIIKVLISLVLNGKKPNFSLPFVQQVDKNEFNLDGQVIEWIFDEYRPKITISMPWNDEDPNSVKEKQRLDDWKKGWKTKLNACKDFDEYRSLAARYEDEYRRFIRREKKGFIEQVAFPVLVQTSFVSGVELFFKIEPPDWLERKTHVEDDFVFPVITSPNTPAPKVKYDKACNILVIRKTQDGEEILLSRRLEGGVGSGEYAVPGGKQRVDETLEDCAKRELLEETNLSLKKSRPVSLYYTRKNFMKGKQVMSVGVLAEDWDGELKTLEIENHVGWNWHKLNDLPEPIFEFSEIAINQYRDGKYPNLSWDDVEEKPEFQPELFRIQ